MRRLCRAVPGRAGSQGILDLVRFHSDEVDDLGGDIGRDVASARRSKVFLVATANDVTRLPAELLRKGRFDEIFFVDLPDLGTRREIFKLHLDRRRIDTAGFDLDALAQASGGFSGAEIEQAIVSSLYEAMAVEAGLNAEHVMQELKRTRPLSVVRAEDIAALREWAAERTVLAD